MTIHTHSRFVQRAERAVAGAVFELSLRQCSPKVIKGLLARGAAAGSPAAELTTEHIKSHLQKYRQHHDRSRQPFRDHFERCLRAPAALLRLPARRAAQRREAHPLRSTDSPARLVACLVHSSSGVQRVRLRILGAAVPPTGCEAAV